jgi:hypothetical protein
VAPLRAALPRTPAEACLSSPFTAPRTIDDPGTRLRIWRGETDRARARRLLFLLSARRSAMLLGVLWAAAHRPLAALGDEPRCPAGESRLAQRRLAEIACIG